MNKLYFTSVEPFHDEFKEKGSKFLGHSIPIKNEGEANSYLKSLRIEHLKANHVCYAYKLGFDEPLVRISDDGEPSGTAGKPILGQIESFQMTNILCVVIRYFGGILLGKGGLVKAYKEAARLSLLGSIKKEIIPLSIYKICFQEELFPFVMNALKKYEINVIKKHYEQPYYITFSIATQNEVILEYLLRYIHQKPVDFPIKELQKITEITLCERTF